MNEVFEYQGLRNWLAQVERLGQLRYVQGVGVEEEIGAATEVLQRHPRAPAVIFDEIPGFGKGFRVLVNGLGTTERLALTLGVPVDLTEAEIANRWRRRLRDIKPLDPVEVLDGPVMENVCNQDLVDMTRFPVPRWHPEDGGRYIGTGSIDITREPDQGWVNLGTYRVMLHGPRELGFYISPGKHGRLHRDRYFARGECMPVAMAFGVDPLLFVAANTSIPWGMNEYRWAGGVRGEPVRVIRGPVTGLPIPADAEIAVEGFSRPGHLLPEGPFGEFSGYYGSGTRPEPVLEVEALYFRNEPILVGLPPGRPPDEHSRYRAVVKSANLMDELERADIPGIKGVWQHASAAPPFLTVVAIEQLFPGHAAQALALAAQLRQGAYCGRYVVVVDDDIDPTNLEEVMWAIATRSDPADSIDILRHAWSTPLDPRITPEQRTAGDFTSSRALINATRPWAWRDKFPHVNSRSRTEFEEARKKWGYLCPS